MSVHHASEENHSERRTFLGVLSGLIAAGISAVMGVTIGRFAISPALTSASAEAWTEVGPLADIPEGKLTRKNVIVSQSAGWGEFNSQKLVWVLRNGEKITIFTAVCPHLGCTVNARDEAFICACHNSKWDVAGKALTGPTPRGLDELEHKVEGDVLKVKYLDFKQGISQKEVLS